jgi:hypothetical protein
VSDRGYSLVELMVAMFAALVVFGGIVTVLQVSTRHQKLVADRVAANQRARPVMTEIINDLHAACVAPGIAPVLPGSSDTSLSFISKTGADVAPVPERHVVSLTGNSLTESVYEVTPAGDDEPPWTFEPEPFSTRELVAGVSPGVPGDPPAVFQYFAYKTEPGQGGELSSTPLDTPLVAADATLTVGVTVSFATSPGGGSTADANAPITLTDSATMRLEPASESVSEVNLPCV